MRECDYYPEGAYNDPNAPYNQVDPADVYEKEVNEILDAKIEERDEDFADFVGGLKGYENVIDGFPEPQDTNTDEWTDWYNTLPNEIQSEIEDKFYEAFFDRVLEDYMTYALDDYCERDCY